MTNRQNRNGKRKEKSDFTAIGSERCRSGNPASCRIAFESEFSATEKTVESKASLHQYTHNTTSREREIKRERERRECEMNEEMEERERERERGM